MLSQNLNLHLKDPIFDRIDSLYVLTREYSGSCLLSTLMLSRYRRSLQPMYSITSAMQPLFGLDSLVETHIRNCMAKHQSFGISGFGSHRYSPDLQYGDTSMFHDYFSFSYIMYLLVCAVVLHSGF